MTPMVLIGIGALMIFGSIAALVGLIESRRQEPEAVKADLSGCTAEKTTIVDADGRIIVPEGAFIWTATRGMYEVWERCINPGPLWTKEGYRWYELDKVGTLVTDEEQEKIKWQLYGYGG